jgi:hypothetical protein
MATAAVAVSREMPIAGAIFQRFDLIIFASCLAGRATRGGCCPALREGCVRRVKVAMMIT